MPKDVKMLKARSVEGKPREKGEVVKSVADPVADMLIKRGAAEPVGKGAGKDA